MDPKWDKWHILLADERLVPYEDPDSNLKLLQEKLLHQLPMIPASHIHGIDYTLLSNISMMDIHDIAKDYQYRCLEPLWKQRIQQQRHTSLHTHESPVLFDCVLLGFGPDGHTCSLFPNHSLLQEQTKWVAALADSPKPPLKRITLTLPVLLNWE
jgi:6-phosphogluconolactonase